MLPARRGVDKSLCAGQGGPRYDFDYYDDDYCDDDIIRIRIIIVGRAETRGPYMISILLLIIIISSSSYKSSIKRSSIDIS